MSHTRKRVGNRSHSGRRLNEIWSIGAAHALYHRDGTWFNRLEHFPGALCDPHGYVLFSSRHEYESTAGVNVGRQTNIPGGIKLLAGYVRVVEY